VGRAANQNVKDSSEFTLTGSYLLDLDRQAAGVASALRTYLTAVTGGPLPAEVLAAIDDAALKAQPKWPRYFSGV
jgi:hypothetical protein